jgi:glycosyltransferase involved in cell wall biosynthesis
LAYLNRQQPDVYFCGQNIGLPLLYRGRTRLVLGILDAIPQRFAEHYIVTLRDRIRYRWMQGAQARKADQIVTISQASQRDIKRFMGVSQVKTIYIRQLAGQSKVRMAANTPPVYVYIGGVEWRKRLDSVVQAFELSLTNHPGSKLYLIGSGYEAVLDKLASDKARPLIVLAGVLSEEKRNALIRRADAVLFPSLYEGYGLPIAEGLLQGVPVICGEGGSQREIGGVSAVYVDPTDVSAIVGAMEKVRTNAFRKSFKEGLTEQVAFLTNPALDDELVRAVVGRS